MPLAVQQLMIGGADRREARATATRLIAQTRSNSAEYPTELANHLAMLLEIQYRLGASAKRLGEYAEIYNSIRKTPPLPSPVAPITRTNWLSALGDRSREADYRSFFGDEVQRLGVSAALRLYLPTLARGIGGSALHPLMRLAYSVLRQDPVETGEALGYWAAVFLPLRDEPQGAPDTDDPLQLAVRMQQTAAFHNIDISKEDLLWHWMRKVGGMDEFAPVIGRLTIGPDTLDRISEASLALFASAIPPLEGVHAMTGSWWVRLISPYVDAPGILARYFWQAILAVYPKVGLPSLLSAEELDAMRRLQIPSAAEIAAATIAFDPLGDDEEHHPSAVFTSFQEYVRTGDPLYLVIAAKRVKLID